jgi:hypothetical protein
MKVEDEFLRKTVVTIKRKVQECSEICNTYVRITWNIKYFYIGRNNGRRTVWVGNVAGTVETRNPNLYLGKSKGTNPSEDIVIYVKVLLKLIGIMWLETRNSNMPCEYSTE